MGGSSSSDELFEDDGLEEQYFSVATDPVLCPPMWELSSMCERTEDDIIARRCALLRRKLRKRPCVPLDSTGSAALSADELASGIRLPLFSCPFQGCTFHTDDRALFLHHVAGGVSDETHVQVLRRLVVLVKTSLG